MPIRIECLNCKKVAQVPDSAVGKSARCKCGASFIIHTAVPDEPEFEMGDSNTQPHATPLRPLPSPTVTNSDESDLLEPIQTNSVSPITGAKFCGSCGNPLTATNAFCSHCGAPVKIVMASQSRSSEIPAQMAIGGWKSRAIFDQASDMFNGTMPQMIKLAMRAIQELGWKLDNVNESIGLITFETGMSLGSWGGVACSLNIEEIRENQFRVTGTGKQLLRGSQLIALDLFGEAKGKAEKVISKMKVIATASGLRAGGSASKNVKGSYFDAAIKAERALQIASEQEKLSSAAFAHYGRIVLAVVGTVILAVIFSSIFRFYHL